VAYGQRLADRIREVVGAEPLLTEQRMFGGHAFLIGGKMAVRRVGGAARSSAWTLPGRHTSSSRPLPSRC
jgi:hypothetical protein